MGIVSSPPVERDPVLSLGEIAPNAEVFKTSVGSVSDVSALVNDQDKIGDSSRAARRLVQFVNLVVAVGVGRSDRLAVPRGCRQSIARMDRPGGVDQRTSNRISTCGVDDSAVKRTEKIPGFDRIWSLPKWRVAGSLAGAGTEDQDSGENGAGWDADCSEGSGEGLN